LVPSDTLRLYQKKSFRLRAIFETESASSLCLREPPYIDNPGLNQVRQKKKDSCNLILSTEWLEFIKIEILG
jgi:hypothetical protein